MRRVVVMWCWVERGCTIPTVASMLPGVAKRIVLELGLGKNGREVKSELTYDDGRAPRGTTQRKKGR